MPVPRLIACDVDGTLLSLGQTQLNPSTIELIKRLREAGIVFAPASGRQRPSLRRLFTPVSNSLPAVAENGTIVTVDDEVIFRATMERALGDEIICAILARDECEALVSGVEVSYLQPKTPEFTELLRDAIKYKIVLVDDATAIPEPYSKIAVYHPNAETEQKYWQQRFGSRCTVAVSGITWIDLMPLGISKATGLKALCTHLGIDPADCLALGDADNDIEMLDFAGDSVAMEHGSAQAKAHAKRTARTADDVFRQILAELDA